MSAGKVCGSLGSMLRRCEDRGAKGSRVWREGVPLGMGSGKRPRRALHRKLLNFLSRNSIIWCILVYFPKFIFLSLCAIFVPARATCYGLRAQMKFILVHCLVCTSPIKCLNYMVMTAFFAFWVMFLSSHACLTSYHATRGPTNQRFVLSLAA